MDVTIRLCSATIVSYNYYLGDYILYYIAICI